MASGAIQYPAVPLNGPDGPTVGTVTVEPRTGATTALVHERSYASRPAPGRRRPLDASFLELRKALRRGGYRLATCGTCQHFRYTAASRGFSSGLSGYCGRGHREPMGSGASGSVPGEAATPVVTLYFGCPEWDGRDERALVDFFARPEATN
jgi:hypothetical protein